MYELAKAIQRDRKEKACWARLARSAKVTSFRVAKREEQQK